MDWKLSTAGTGATPAWDSADGSYKIIDCRKARPGARKPFRLVSFVHDPPEGEDVRTWDFATLDEAKDYAERI